jgi:transposase-like protein
MAKTGSADRQRYWEAVIERQQASGQSIVGFCSKVGLAPASFRAWKRRLRPQRGRGRTSARQTMIPVQIVSDPSTGNRRDGL